MFISLSAVLRAFISLSAVFIALGVHLPYAHSSDASSTFNIRLQWDPNSESFLAGYKVYYGYKPGGPYAGVGALEGASPVTLVFDPLIVDDGDLGTFYTGNWGDSGGKNPYGAGSLWNTTAGDTYVFTGGVIPGAPTRLYLWWTTTSDRCTETPVSVFDGDTLVVTLKIDQSADSGQWNGLGGIYGAYVFKNSTVTVKIDSPGGCSACADALKIETVFDKTAPTFTLHELNSHTAYYFVVTAHDNEGLESGYSNEINTLDTVQPYPVKKAGLGSCSP